jgi:hypothetical protein
MDNLQIHRLTDERVKDVQYLIKTVFNKFYSIDYLTHKYSRSVLGVKHVCCLGYINEKPVAFYGALPHLVSVNGQEDIVAQTCDSYTAKAYQGRGIHKKMALASYEVMKKSNVKAVFALHSENTYHSCKKLGWDDGFTIKRMHLKRKILFPYFKLLSKYTFLRSLKERKVKRALLGFKLVHEIENPLKKSHRFYAIFDQEYIKYKNAFNNYIIEVSGCRLWLKFNSIIMVGAINGLNHQNCAQVISALKRLMTRLGTNEVLFQMGEYDPAFEILSREMKPKESYRVGHLALDSAVNFHDFRVNYIELDSML